MLEVWCDGSSTGRSNREGGWAFILIRNFAVVEANYGGDPHTTNNRMEALAAIQGVKRAAQLAQPGEEIVIVSDSQYCLGIADGTMSPAANLDLATELRYLFERYCAGIRWVKGHSKNALNDRVDSLAKRGKAEAMLLSKNDPNRNAATAGTEADADASSDASAAAKP